MPESFDTPVVRKTTRAGERLKAKKIKPEAEVAQPVVFRCIRYPELKFKVGGEIAVDAYGRQRLARMGKWRQFHNTQFIARTEEEMEYCRSKGWIFEEPPIPKEAYDEDGKYLKKLDPRLSWDDPVTNFETHNKDCWDAYLKKLRS